MTNIKERTDKALDIASMIIDYESGLLDEDEVIALFQRLVGTGLAWKLQGSYGRTAQTLIDAGLVRIWKKKRS